MLKTTAGGAAADGTLTTKITELTKQLDVGTADSLAAKIADASKTIPNTAVVNFKDAYDKFSAAATDSINLIDKALESNELTELDTTNLKALRSYINETKATFDNAVKDSGLSATADNTAGTVTQDAIDKLKAGLNSATMGKITAEFDENGQNSFAKKIAEAIKTPTQPVDFKADYDRFAAAVKASTDIIDKSLESNDLTELDTTNLKALRSYITETLATVDTAIKDSGLDKTAPNQPANVKKEQLEKIQAGLNSAKEIDETAKEKGADGTKGDLKTQLAKITDALNTTDGIQKIVADAAAGTAPAANAIKTKFDALKGAVEKANTAIDAKLESGDLTQLDTSNLKALRSSINDIQSQLESTLKDFGVDPSQAATPITQDKAKELQEALKTGVVASDTELERATSSKAAMEGLLGKDGKGGDLKTQFDAITAAFTNNTTGIQKLVETAVTTAGNAGKADLDVSTAVTALKTAVGAAADAIDEKLESGDLTQLDTANLKALRSSINDIQSQVESAFADFSVEPNKDTNNNITPAKVKELQETFKAVETSNTELGKKAVGVAGIVGTQIKAINDALTGQDGIQKLVDDATKAGAQGTLNVKTKFDALKAAVTAANKAIDEKLNSGDLTQLDTSNLKALRSSITDIQSQLESTFADFNVDTTQAAPIAQDKAKELL